MKIIARIFTFMIGAAFGAVLGVLFAPRKGSITRARIKNKAEEEKEMIEEKKRDMLRKRKDMSDKANEHLESLKSILRRREE